MHLEIIKKTNTAYNESVLFVHGAYHAAWCWREHFIDFFFNSGYNVYALSFRNHGNSEKIEDIDSIKMNDLVDDLEQAINKIPGKIYLVAHSMGCRVVQLYLNAHPEHIAKLVLLTPMPVKNTFRQLVEIKIRQSGKKMEYILFSERLTPKEIKEYIALLEQESPKVEYGLMSNVKLEDSIRENIPCLVLGSFNDRCIILQSTLDNAKIHNAQLIIYSQICHNMMLDPEWKRVANDILSFFGKKGY